LRVLVRCCETELGSMVVGGREGLESDQVEPHAFSLKVRAQ
jgi:hypothetical protein